MCGIFGYLNFMAPRTRKEIIDILLKGLRRMEYRGYDSAGFAIDSADDAEHPHSQIRVIRCKGKVDDLTKCVEEKNSDLDMEMVYNIHCGIAHTRWATHGQPTDINSHPHRSDPENEFVVVHNGIITNYRSLREFLTRKGFQFESETDTEVVVKFAKYIYSKYPRLSFQQIVEITEGAYSLLFKSKHFPGQLIATRRGSPLIVGIRSDSAECPIHIQFSRARMVNCDDTLTMESHTPNEITPRSGKSLKNGHGADLSFLNDTDRSFMFENKTEYFFASDASAIIEHTKQVMFLEDDDIASIKAGQLSIHRIKRAQVEGPQTRLFQELQLELEEIMRGDYETFMQKEIYEQPESVLNTMRGRVLENNRIQLGGMKEFLEQIEHTSRYLMVACGTSYNSALAARTLIEELCRVPVQVELASDFTDRPAPIQRSDICFFISQSGETADTLGALRYCLKKGAFCVGITNTVGSSICRETHCGIHLNAGPEIGVASTKAYTSQIIALVMFAISVAQNHISALPKCTKVVEQLRKLSENVSKTLKVDKQVLAIASTLYKERSMLVMGRGYNYATCLEGALKIKELSYQHCEGIMSGELKHGPLAMVDESSKIIMIICSDDVYKKSLNALQQVLARGGRPIVIADTEVPQADLEAVEHVIRVPKTVDCLQNILTIIPLQLMSYHIADLNGCNVDRPRNLAKSVTVE